MHELPHDNDQDRWMWTCCAAALQADIASWRRRNTRLLEINSGQGLCLQMLWECGFDVTGTAASPDERSAAAANAPYGTEILAASDDDIPVETDAFDWVILHLGEHDAAQMRQAVKEAVRIASRGVVISFWNRSSLLRALHALGWTRITLPCRGLYVWQVLAAVRDLPGKKRLSGCLPVPLVSRLFSLLGGAGRICTALLGAWTMLRINLDPAASGTPLGLRTGHTGPLAQGAAVMECRAGGKN